MLLCVYSTSQLQASPNTEPSVSNSAVSANKSARLDSNTLYCRNKVSLKSYLAFAQKRDMQGLNLMVETGDCDFTPDDKKINIQKISQGVIGTITVVEFQWKNKTLWTFQKLLLPLQTK